jgi:mRNA interferase MazF
MPFEFGAIVLVPFPVTSQTASKRRPDVVVMAVTSQLHPNPALGEVWIADWESAGLLKPSAIKPVFATLERTLVLRELGILAAKDRAALRRAIREVLG